MSKINWNLFKTKDTVLEAAIVGITWGLIFIIPLLIWVWVKTL